MNHNLSNAASKVGDGLSKAARAIPFEAVRERFSWRWAVALLMLLLLVCTVIGVYMSREPDQFNVIQAAKARAEQSNRKMVTGYVTTATLIQTGEILLNKPGGYLSNDRFSPAIFLDNMPSWEFGVVVQMRDLARSMRNDMSRSRSQSQEDPDLAKAEPQFNIQHNSWVFPSTESEYEEGLEGLETYLARLSDPNQQNAQFYARADNLSMWLGLVEKRLGGLSQRLAASVGPTRVNTDLAGEAGASQSTPAAGELLVKTPWTQLDNVFFEARGSTWALLHYLKAIEADFDGVLADKNAKALLRQVIRELEATQQAIWSPMILNGGGFGIFANHSLVMASYISRANAAVIELRNLLANG